MTALIGALLVGPLAASVLGAGHAVKIVDRSAYDYAFNPTPITVHVGDTVTWTNKSVDAHNVSIGSVVSPDLGTGGTFSHTFTKPGSFSYLCTIHYFYGKVIVVGATATPRPTSRPTPKPSAKPTPRPTPQATSQPTAKPAPTPASTAKPAASSVPSSAPATTAQPFGDSSPAASSDLGLVAPFASPPPGGSTSASPGTDASSTGPPLILLVALALVVVAVGGIGLLARGRH